MDIKELREEINEIDEELVALFKRRMDVSGKVAEYKIANDMPILDKERERQLLSKVCEMSSENYETYTKALYGTILNLSRAYQHKLIDEGGEIASAIQGALKSTNHIFPKRVSVACQGVSGSYSEAACEKAFELPAISFFSDFEGVFKAVRDGLCDYGILPLENSTAGSVNRVYDLMRVNKFYIVKSVRLKVDHCLLAKKGVLLSDIKEVFSHEQALNQCSDFLKAHGIKATVCENTAIASKLVASSDRKDIAAISSESCCELYGLSALSHSVQNNENNYTRFICISKKLEIYPGADRSSFMMTIPHRPGSLYSVISRFYSLGINLEKLESRPLPGRDFEVMFYFDISSSIYSDETIELIDELETTMDEFSYLGSYTEVL